MRNSGKTTRGMRRKSYRGSNTGRRLMPNDAQRRERIRNALMLTIVLLELILVLVVGACVMLRRNSELVFESILENEKQDLKFSVDNVIKDLDRQRRDLEAEGLSDEKIKTVVQKHLYAKIHSDQFSDSQYMWVNQILNYADILQKLYTSGIEPTPYVLPISNAFREDVALPGVTQEEALKNAPAVHNGGFKVPRVIE